MTNIELFFDLVFVFAVTQLSHSLLGHLSVEGGLQTVLLLAMVWFLWVYTTWVTNWLDPERLPVRLLLLGLMLVSLVLSAALPNAFAQAGLVVGAAYAVMQVGRSAFAVAGLRGDPCNATMSASWSGPSPAAFSPSSAASRRSEPVNCCGCWRWRWTFWAAPSASTPPASAVRPPRIGLSTGTTSLNAVRPFC